MLFSLGGFNVFTGQLQANESVVSRSCFRKGFGFLALSKKRLGGTKILWIFSIFRSDLLNAAMRSV